MWRPLPALLAFSALVVPATVLADGNYAGVGAGLFYPSDTKVRDAMGDAWLSFGLSQVSIKENNPLRKHSDWHIITKENNGSKVFLLTGSLGVIMPLSNGSSVSPYLAVRGGATYEDYAMDITENSTTSRLSNKVLVLNANAEFGINVGDRLNLSFRYDVFSERDGLRFNGLGIALKYGILKF